MKDKLSLYRAKTSSCSVWMASRFSIVGRNEGLVTFVSHTVILLYSIPGESNTTAVDTSTAASCLADRMSLRLTSAFERAVLKAISTRMSYRKSTKWYMRTLSKQTRVVALCGLLVRLEAE